jgi:hypothetical protein
MRFRRGAGDSSTIGASSQPLIDLAQLVANRVPGDARLDGIDLGD